MSKTFLTTFMQVAQAITGAECCLARDAAQNVVAHMNIDEDRLASDEFHVLADKAINEATQKQSAVITNNMITDPQFAPKTNVHLTNLRIAAAIPLAHLGAVYLEQLVRNGVFERDVIDRLHATALALIDAGEMEISADELHTRYEQD